MGICFMNCIILGCIFSFFFFFAGLGNDFMAAFVRGYLLVFYTRQRWKHFAMSFLLYLYFFFTTAANIPFHSVE